MHVDKTYSELAIKLEEMLCDVAWARLRNVRTCSAERGPHTIEAPHMCARNFITSKLPISANKETSQNKVVGKYVLLYTKIDTDIV